MPSSAALLAGLALDAMVGDPPNWAHPVAWFGRVAAALDRAAPRTRWAGVGATTAAVTGAAAVATGLGWRLSSSAVDAGVVWLCVSRRTLLERAGEVAEALEAGDLAEAQRLLAFHLVSRDTSELTLSEVAGAAIESVAENLSDGVVGPAFWYFLAGTPAIAAYRALNTLDGMWGYRTAQYEAFGWAAARGDDAVNLVPARLTALALVLASGRGAPGALRAWRRGRGLTESPNAGHPMAAMAGALGVTLRKRGHYALNEGRCEPAVADLRRAVALADRASVLALIVLVLVLRGRS